MWTGAQPAAHRAAPPYRTALLTCRTGGTQHARQRWSGGAALRTRAFAEETLEPDHLPQNLERVVYVFGEMAGKSPVNAVLNLSSHFKAQRCRRTRVVWSGEGEWNITLDVFRDLGMAFGARWC